MFNSEILDVAIGMIFVYLLLSLICSAANETIEMGLKKRATDLERGIRELLVPGNPSGPAEIVQQLYNHPLINGLFGGVYEQSRIRNPLRYIWRTKLPSYIPSRSFALALMDLILPAQPAPPAPQPLGAPPPASAAATLASAARRIWLALRNLPAQPAPPVPAAATPAAPAPSGAAGASRADFDVKLDAIPDPPPAPTVPGNPLHDLRNEVATTALLNAAPQARRALMTLIDAAGNDAAKARQNIEDWYNTSMDRVSGWYKRRAHIFIMIIGLFVAVWLNADSVAIVRALSTDKSLRELTVTEAIKYANETASPSPPPAGSDSAKATGKPGTSCPMPACDSDKNSPECKLQKSKCQLKELGLPLGWNSPDDPRRQTPKSWDDVWNQLRWHLLGWLITALAISLGAPFWFDLLNKFIVVRSTVKPKEKSLEEKSKD